jgi:catechol 2,3-dioxygenase-like lactoylglutathione lyase family enzyme
MRLRQIALATEDLDAVTGQLETVFGCEVAYNDPGIIHYGLKNAVLPAGNGFIEVLSPVRADASAARFLARKGGDAGYMLIFQVGDAEAEQARVAALGVRVVDVIDRKGYRAAHFHPNDFGGVLSSIDEQRGVADHLEARGDWWPAGPRWREAREGPDLRGVVLASDDPQALARRWSDLLGRPLAGDDRLPLDRGELRFARGEGQGTQFLGVELGVADAAATLARAAGLDVNDDGVLIGGVRFKPVEAALGRSP